MSAPNLFAVSLADVQTLAVERFNRELTENEIRSIEKSLMWGFEHWGEMVNIALDEVEKEAVRN